MLKACLIDDEELALKYLEKLLLETHEIDVIGTFLEPKEFLRTVTEAKPDVVFLDIEMAMMNGLELAEEIQMINPSIQIIFVTAYEMYAVKAFELNALDYIVKPLQRQRIAGTVARIKERYMETNKLESEPVSAPVICSFGQLQIFAGDRLLETKWRTLKAKELFAYIVQHHKFPIPKYDLTEIFWSSLPWEKANSQLYSAIYQIRKVLKGSNVPVKIINNGEYYGIELNETELEKEIWEKRVAAALLMEKTSLETAFALLDDYKGPYLQDIPYEWAVNERERLKEIWQQLIKRARVEIKQLTDPEEAEFAKTRLKSLISGHFESEKELESVFNKF